MDAAGRKVLVYAPLETLINQALALYHWTTEHEGVLIEAARRVFKHVLFDHIRARDPDNASNAARKWIENITLQMKEDGFESCEDSIKISSKPKRGRPKKEILPKILDLDEEGRIQTRSQSNSTAIVDTTTSLFQTASLTISPKKDMKKVAIFLLLSYFWAKDVDELRISNAL